MRHLFSTCFLALSLILSVPAFGDGTVYVPLLMDVVKSGHRVQTEVTITNTTGNFKSFTELLIGKNVDGMSLNRSGLPTRTLGPWESTTLQSAVGSGGVAMVEVTADEGVVVTTRLMTVSGGYGTEAPVVSSLNAIPAGTQSSLQGWIRDLPNLRTDYHFINLGHQATSCTLVIQDSNGILLHSGYSFSVGALRLFSLSDALSLLQVNGPQNVTVNFDCDQRYFPFATVHDASSGETTFLSPSGSGSSTLTPPSGSNSIVHEEPGIFHIPTLGNESKRFNYSFPGNPTFSKIIVDMDFKHGGWFPETTENHAIFWLQRSNRWGRNVFGYVNAFGTGSDFVKMATNADLSEMQAKTKNVILEPGATYHVHFEYDAAAGFYEVTLTRGGQEVVRIRDDATVDSIQTVESLWFLDFGHNTGAVGPEVPTYGWEYSNLRVEWIP